MFIITQSTQSGIDTPYVCMYYVFRPIAAIVGYVEPLQSSFYLLYLPTLASVYTLGVHCLGILFM
jgi:hypothetical protein